MKRFLMPSDDMPPAQSRVRRSIGTALLCLVGLVLLFGMQSLLAPLLPAAPASPPEEEVPLALVEVEEAEEGPAGDGLPAEYDPDAALAFNQAAQDDRPFWLVSVDLGLKLFIVLGLAYAALVGLRRLQGGAPRVGGARSSTVRVVETVGLAPNRALHLVAVGEKVLLIGATEHHLSLLTEVAAVAPAGEPEAFAEALAAAEGEPAMPASPWEDAMESLRSNVRRLRATAEEEG